MQGGGFGVSVHFGGSGLGHTWSATAYLMQGFGDYHMLL
jgi:hypothetical protein